MKNTKKLLENKTKRLLAIDEHIKYFCKESIKLLENNEKVIEEAYTNGSHRCILALKVDTKYGKVLSEVLSYKTKELICKKVLEECSIAVDMEELNFHEKYNYKTNKTIMNIVILEIFFKDLVVEPEENI